MHHRGRGADVAPRGSGGAGRARTAVDVGGRRARGRGRHDTARGPPAARQRPDRLLPDVAIRRCRCSTGGAARGRSAAPALLGHRRHDDPEARRRHRAAHARGRARPCVGHERRGARHATVVQEAGRALSLLVQARRQAAVPVGSRRPTRPRSRTKCSKRGSRSQCSTTPAAHMQAPVSTSIGTASGGCWRR